jgi:hypothetical protein
MLKTLLVDFDQLSPDEQEAFFSSYYQKRNGDLAIILESKKVKSGKITKKAAKKGNLITVSLEQLNQLKALGLVK